MRKFLISVALCFHRRRRRSGRGPVSAADQRRGTELESRRTVAPGDQRAASRPAARRERHPAFGPAPRIISQREAFGLRREANRIEVRLNLRQPQRHQRPRVRLASGPGQPARAAPAHRAPRPRRPPLLSGDDRRAPRIDAAPATSLETGRRSERVAFFAFQPREPLMAITPLMPVYPRSPVRPVRGEGVYLYGEGGEKYLDFASGIAVNLLGHGHPASDQGDPGAGGDPDPRLQPLRLAAGRGASPSGWST